MKQSSDLLLHFVHRTGRDDASGQVDVLMKILANGLRFSRQSLSAHCAIGSRASSMAVSAICFTDLPLRSCDPHAARYGKCAIGVRKSFVKNRGGNPVLYLVDKAVERSSNEADWASRKNLRGSFGDYVMDALDVLARAQRLPADHWSQTLNDDQHKGMNATFGYLFAYFKEMFDLGNDVDDEDDPRQDRYFHEREWRIGLTQTHEAIGSANVFVPSLTLGGLQGSEPLVRKDSDGSCYLTLPSSEVRVLVLPNERVRREVAKRLADAWGAENVPTLITYDESRDL